MLKDKRKSVFLIIFAILCVTSLGAVTAAPSADFTSNVTNGTSPLSVQFNDTSTDNPTSWLWDFGDGYNSTSQNPMHNYTKAGKYTVSLKVADASGNDTITKTNYILVFGSAAKNRFTNPGFESGNLNGWISGSTTSISSTIRHSGQYGVHFGLNGNQNTNFVQQNVDLTLVDSISFWGYGEGTTSPFKVYIGNSSRTFSATSDTWTKYTIATSNYTGIHTITIRWLVNSACFDVDDFSTEVSKNQANFSASTTEGLRPLPVEFNDKSLGLITDWLWDFGDGTTSTEQNPTHIYTKSGKYTVKLTVSWPSYTSTKTINITVIGPFNTRTGKYYDSIQAAVDDAQNGDTINVGNQGYPETYTENVEITKRLKLIAQGNIIITALNANNPVFSILPGGNNSQIEGFIITGATNSYGIYIAPSINATITRNTIRNNKIGVYVAGTATITNSTFTDNDTGIYVNGKATITGNKVTGNDVGVHVKGNATITSNTVKGNDIGINVDNGTSTIHFNNIYDNGLYGLKFTGNSVDAANNWWGTNSPVYVNGTVAPAKADIYEAQNANHAVHDPWIVLKVSASDNLLKKGDKSTITVDMTRNSKNQDTSGSGSIPDLPVNFNYTLGTLTTTSTTVTKGKASTIVTGGNTSGTAKVNATVTGYTVGVSVTVDTIAPTASADLSNGSYKTTQKVKLTTDDTSAVIYYTTDTTNPQTSSTRKKYTGTITISKTTSLRYAVIDPAGNWSPLYIQNYVIGTGGLANSAWPGFQNNDNHNGQSIYKGPQNGTVKWIYNNIAIYGSPVIGKNGTIYVGGADGKLYVFSSNGKLKWTYGTRSPIFGSPTVGVDGTVYISNWMNSTTYAINSKGKLLWKYTTGDYNFGSSPTIGADGIIYVSTTNMTNGTLYAFYPDGKLKWKYNKMGIIYGSSPVIGPNGTIYLTDYNGMLYAMNPDGTLKWSYTLKYVSGDVDYFASMYYNTPSIGPDGTIYLVNYESRYTLWLTPYTQHEYVNPTGSSLFAVTDNGTFATLKWSPYLIGEHLYGAPTISYNGTIYVTGETKLYAIVDNGTNANSLWPLPYNKGTAANDGFTSAVIGGDGTIYIGNSTGLQAVNPDGTSKWFYTTSGGIGSFLAIGADGTLYVGTTTGLLYAFSDNATDFTAEHINGTASTIQFTDKSIGDIKSWKWDFGDGKTSTMKNPAHAYSKGGNYIVTLTVTLQDGSVITGAKLVKVVEKDIAPPTVTANPNGGTFNTPQTVTLKFTDNSGKATVYYTIDGSDPRNSSTRKTYKNPFEIGDTMTLKFAAVDAAGNWSPVYTKKYTILEVVYVQDASHYTHGTLSDQIQSILDKAEPGSPIVFLGKLYENLQLNINKKLNIISYVGTKITNSSTVFLINGSKASGTKINGFTIITDDDSGIMVNNANNVTIYDVQVTSTNGTAITVNKSSNTIIKDSVINDSSTGVKIYDCNNTQIINNKITENQKDGVTVENSSKTKISQGQISNNGETGVKIYNSQDITIMGVTITGNGKSGAGTNNAGIYVQDSDKIVITENQINENWHGISTRNIDNTTIKLNTISDNERQGILLSGITDGTIILSNVIQRNNNGIMLDGNHRGVTIQANLITDSRRISGYVTGIPWEYDGHGVVFGPNSVTVMRMYIFHNIVINNGHRDFETRYGALPFKLEASANWYVTYCPYCSVGGQMEIVLTRTGENEFTFRLWDPVTKVFVTGLPEFPVEFRMGPITENVMAKNGTAVVKFNLKTLMGLITASSYEYSVSLPWDSPIIDIITGKPVTQKTDSGFYSYEGNGGTGNGNGDGSGDGSGNGNGDGTGDGSGDGSGTGSGDGSGDGSGSDGSSGTPSSMGIASAASAASAAAGGSSAGQSGSNGNVKTVQELLVDEVNKPEVWGIIGIILLVILVLGAYYRTDLKNMIQKSKK